jgi:hypothetical protein
VGRQHWTLSGPGQSPAWKAPPEHGRTELSRHWPTVPDEDVHEAEMQHLMLSGSKGQAPVTKKPGSRLALSGPGSVPGSISLMTYHCSCLHLCSYKFLIH